MLYYKVLFARHQTDNLCVVQLYFQRALFSKLKQKLPNHKTLLDIREGPRFLGTLGFLLDQLALVHLQSSDLLNIC